MHRQQPVSLLVVGSALFVASCVTVHAQPLRAAGPGPLPPAAQTFGATDAEAGAEGAAPAEGGPSAEGPALPETEGGASVAPEVSPPMPPHHMAARPGCGHGAPCPRCAGRGGPPMEGEGHGPTDHQKVVGRWGIEARSLETVETSPNNPETSDCTGEACRQVRLTSIGIRRWHTESYAYSAGLALAMGGGSNADGASWDTHFGVGPTVGAYFLLSQWKHLAISATPQLGMLYFAPSGSGNKTFTVDVQGKVEAELQLGFMGLPGLAVGTDAGIGFKYKRVSDDFSRWTVGTVGPGSLWGIVTNAFVRYYL